VLACKSLLRVCTEPLSDRLAADKKHHHACGCHDSVRERERGRERERESERERERDRERERKREREREGERGGGEIICVSMRGHVRACVRASVQPSLPCKFWHPAYN
jgi:hypothetical protein